LALILAGGGLARAEDVDRAMFGNSPSRNMVSEETGLPETWDVKTGLNIKWSRPTGSQSYAGPVLAAGRIYVGTNNEGLRDPALKGDRGVVMAFAADDGEFLWQMVHPKLPAGRVNDWPLQGVCSTPYVEGDRLYYVSNEAHVVCLDAEGFGDGENDGPFTSETETGEQAGDVIWSYDLIAELDAFPHNLATSSPLVVGDVVYASTGNGVDEGHVNIPSPLAPSFVAVNKNTGELLWENAMPGNEILHGTWTNPSYAEIGGVKQILFPGGDGWLYSLEPETGELIWKFDCNPKDSEWILGGRGTRNNLISSPVVYDGKVYIGVGQDPEHGEAPGHFWAIDGSGKGDVTDTHAVWHRGGEDFHRTISTAAIHDDIVYISDLSGFLYALDAQTGEHYWTYDTFAAVWGSAFAADGKVYLGDEDGDVVILKAGKELVEIDEVNMGGSVYTTPIARDGVLYVLSRNHLYAIQDGIPAKQGDAP
jgi:outer membrane protein assembly factor BamB